MLVRLLLLFTVVPLVELVLLLVLADRTSWQFTLALVIVTGIVGAALARYQGVRCWQRVSEQLAAGQVPGSALLDAMLILVAGALLITPGVLTDLVGFALLVPPTRRAIRQWLKRRLSARMQFYGPPSGSPPPQRDRIIDVKIIDKPAEEQSDD
jgi:UPF0716 protein FxsA